MIIEMFYSYFDHHTGQRRNVVVHKFDSGLNRIEWTPFNPNPDPTYYKTHLEMVKV